MPKYREYQGRFRINKPESTRGRGRGSSKAAAASNSNTQHKDPNTPTDKQHRGDKTDCDATLHGRGGRHDESRISEAQYRLERLESVVSGLIQSSNNGQLTSPFLNSSTGASSVSPRDDTNCPSSPADGLSLSPNPNLQGHLDIKGTETQYLGATHWTTILDDIKEIQHCLASEVDEEDDFLAGLDSTQDIVIPHTDPLDLDEACRSLPHRAEVDKLLSVYFSAKYLHIPFIHKQKFLREYESFWRDPTSVPFLWISMLFSALHVGCRNARSAPQAGSCMQNDTLSEFYLTKAYQTLIAGQYQKSKPYSVEALLLYAVCKLFQNHHPDTEPWMLIGTSARVALKMGYHRDPRHLPHISPFEGEMRRRTFYVVQTLDLLLSFQAGLPSIIHEDMCDTETPRNLFDEDFDETCTDLPPSRPPIDLTPMLYYSYKGRLAQVFRRVAWLAISLKVPSYDRVMLLDKELHELHASIPPSLDWRPICSSVMDDEHMIMSRLNIALLYQKSLMILHRNYLSRDRQNSAFEYSRKACVAASVQVLQYQAEVYAAAQPGGQLENGHWISSRIVLHDFLLAATITCLDLYESFSQNEGKAISEGEEEAQTRKYDALKVSHDIWSSQQSTTRDAKRATSILGVMLSKIPRPQRDLTDPETDVSTAWHPGPLSSAQLECDRPEPTGMGRKVHSDETATKNGPMVASDTIDPFLTEDADSATYLDSIFGDPDEVDWGIIDQFIFDRDTNGELTL